MTECDYFRHRLCKLTPPRLSHFFCVFFTSVPSSSPVSDEQAFEIPAARPSADATAAGFRQHIPTDLESLPDAFRRRGVIRSHPLLIVPVGSEGAQAGPTSLKRTHSSMLQEDLQGSGHFISLGNLPALSVFFGVCLYKKLIYIYIVVYHD